MKTFKLFSAQSILIASLLFIAGIKLQGESALMCNLDCDMQCISQINLSISEQTCSANLLPSMVLPGIGTACDGDPDILIEIFDDHDNRLEDEFGNPINVVTTDHVGLNLKYKITNNLIDPVTGSICGNSCWGNILVEYKFLPEIECRGTQILSCGALDALPLPDVRTGSGSCLPRTFEVYLANEVRETLHCDDDYTHRVVRTYEASDGLGNVVSCEDTFLLQRINLTGIQFPGLTKISCSELDSFKLNEEGCPLPWITGPSSLGGMFGVPYICDGTTGESYTAYNCPLTGSGTGIPFIPQSGATVLTDEGEVEMVMGDIVTVCSAAVLYTDVPFPDIGCTKKFVRQWEIREWWCNEEIPRMGMQQVEIIDDVAPIVECPDDFTVSTNDDCAGNVELPRPTAMDACNHGVNITVEHPWGTVVFEEGKIPTADLQVGMHQLLRYKISDDCYNERTCEVRVTVKDNTEPVSVCERFTVVSISQDGNTLVSSDVFDDGSWDECSEIRTCAMRMEDQVRFRTTAADTIYNGIKYILRSNMELGCVQKYVEGIFLNGEEYLSEDDLCVPYVRFCCTDVGNEIMVVFRAMDYGGNHSDCMVNVEVQDKAVPSLICPEDRTIDCREPYDLNNLGLIFGNYQVVDNCASNANMDTLINANINQCGIGTIERKFEVIDDFAQVVRSCKQTIEIVNERPFDPNTIEWPQDFIADCGSAGALLPENLTRPYDRPYFPTGDDACSLLGYDYEDEFFANDVLAGGCGVIQRTWTVIDWCTQVDGSFVTWTDIQQIKIENDERPEILEQMDMEFSSNNIDCEIGDIRIERMAVDDCTGDENLQWSYEMTGGPDGIVLVGDSSVIEGTFKAGLYKINWQVCDDCKNCTTVEQELDLINTKAPIPICMNGLSIGLDENGETELWAEDIDGGSYHPCENAFNIGFDDTATLQVEFYDCEDFLRNDGLNFVNLYVIDAKTGIGDFCTARVLLTDPFNHCGNDEMMVEVKGDIFTEEMQSVEEVEVALGSNMPMEMTDNEGHYAFGSMPIGGQYEVQPAKDNDDLNGISTLDLIMIQRHILGLEALDSPYKLIAADVNDSGEVNGLDLVELRKLILGVYSKFPDNESWRFVDAAYQFVDATNPWLENMSETYEILDLESDMEIDFVGVKIGDVNGSVVSNNVGQNLISKRAQNTLNLNFGHESLTAFEIHTIPVSIENYSDIEGWQLSLKIDQDKVEFIGIDSDALLITEQDFFWNDEAGILNISYVAEPGMNRINDEILFNLIVKAKSSVEDPTDFLAIASESLLSEAYKGKNTFNLSIERLEEQAQILAVSPNPWINETKISFYLNSSEWTNWEFFSMDGRRIYQFEGYFNEGRHDLKIKRSDLNVQGVVYMRMTTGSSILEQRMMLLN